jgi:ArsR family transcriptional regulator
MLGDRAVPAGAATGSDAAQRLRPDPQAGIRRSGRTGVDRRRYFYIFGIMKKEEALAALAALAQESRLDVFRLLVRAGSDGLAVGEIAEALELPSPTLSFHLKELTSAGLLRFERVGRSRIYRPDFAAMQRLVGFLSEHCCEGVERPGPVRARRREGERA